MSTGWMSSKLIQCGLIGCLSVGQICMEIRQFRETVTVNLQDFIQIYFEILCTTSNSRAFYSIHFLLVVHTVTSEGVDNDNCWQEPQQKAKGTTIIIIETRCV